MSYFNGLRGANYISVQRAKTGMIEVKSGYLRAKNQLIPGKIRFFGQKRAFAPGF